MIRIVFAVFIGAALTSSGVFADCPGSSPKRHPAKAHMQADNCVNLGAVPQISEHIVATEPAPVAKAPSYSDSTPAKYEGPTLGLTKPEPGVRPAPTVGYHWSLE